MRDKIIPVLVVLAVSMFCGFIVIATGLGTVTSPLNRIGGPMVCGDSMLEIEKDSTVHIQGEQPHKVTAYCVDAQTDAKRDVTIELNSIIPRLQITTGVLSGLILLPSRCSF